MPDHEFNEAEAYLLENWEMATQIEDSMEAIRGKYQALCEKIAEQVKESHKELDSDRVEVERSSGAFRVGGLVLGRQSWPSTGKNYPTGFWVWNLRLESLVDSEQDEAIVGFWLCWEDKADDVFYEQAEKAIKDTVKKRLTSEQIKIWEFGDNEDKPLIGRQIAPKQELLRMLSKGESERFIDIIVEQLEELILLIPDIDQILDKKAMGGR